MTVDSDADGFLSCAILLNYVYKVFPSAINKFHYVFHPIKAHGICMEDMPPWTTLVMALDASSNEFKKHEQLRKNGIDVIVLDHHIAEHISEFACVVNNQLCSYPNKTLCGGGIVYKFCEYLDSLLEVNYSEDLIDLAAVAIISDMMDLRNLETMYIVQEGLKKIKNPFLKAMIEHNSFSIGPQITPIGIAFYVTPLINAITRVGTMEEKQLLFESMLEYKAEELIPSTKRGCSGQMETRVEQSVRTATNVKNRQTKLRDAASVEIINEVNEKGLLNHKLLIIPFDGNIDGGIRGLIANELMSKYKRPTILLSLDEEGNYSGSARGYEKSQLKDFRNFCLKSGLCRYAEGHKNAFGYSIQADKLQDFVKWSDEALKDIEFSPNYKVDYINPTPQQVLDITDYNNIWRQNIEEPLIAMENIMVTKEKLFLMSRDKNPTIKINLPNGIACIKFKASEEEFNNLYSDNGAVTINLVGRCNKNEWNGNITPQVLITDYEIVNKQDWVF